MSNAIPALQVYNPAAKLSNPAMSKAQESAPNGESFSELVKGAVNNVENAGKKAESLASDMAAGKADLVDLVTAVSETEVAVETLVTVRDRVITAYQEIMNMPI